MISLGADIHVTDDAGMTLYDWAEAGAHPDTITYLVAQGVLSRADVILAYSATVALALGGIYWIRRSLIKV